MTGLPILSGATSLAHFKSLLPVAFQHRNVAEDVFIADALVKAKTFDAAISADQLWEMLGVANAADDSGNSSPRVAGWVNEINQKYAWIEANASIYRLEYGDFIEPAKFKTQMDNQTVSVNVGGNSKKFGIGTAWLKQPERRQHRQLVMRPSSGTVTDDNCLNEWKGFAVTPREGDYKPFIILMKRLMPERAALLYVLEWLAHLIQHPDVKMHVSLAFWSRKQGVGKNLLFECISRIIGVAHATVIGQAELGSEFNGWANRKVLVIGDEVSKSDRRQDTDKLKGLITGSTLYVNEKYQPAREVPNLLNFIFLSNHHDALFVDDADRRYFVWEIAADRLPDSDAKILADWRDNGGLGALLHFLQHHDISGFNPKAPAPMTAAKQQMVQDNRSDLETWLADLMASDVAQVLGREVLSGHELANRYDQEMSRKGTSAKTMTGAAKRLGALARGNQVRVANGKKVRLIAITRADYWVKQPDAGWAEEFSKPLTRPAT